MKLASTLALGLGLLALVAGTIWTEASAHRAEQEFPAVGTFIEVRGARLHVVVRGAGTPIVLLHGAYGGVDDWIAPGILDELARTHRVIAFDRPGHGWSERTSSDLATPLEQARILREACRSLGVERPMLVGFSWSGALALAWAMEWPDEIAGVLCVNGVAYSWPGATATAYVLASVPIVGSLLAHAIATPFGQLTERAAIERAFDPAEIPATFERSPIPLALRPTQFLAEAEEMRILKPALAIQSPRYADIRVPLEILAGRGDLVAHWDWHAAHLQRVVHGSELTVVDGAGHQMLYSHPRAVIDAVERLANRVKTE